MMTGLPACRRPKYVRDIEAGSGARWRRVRKSKHTGASAGVRRTPAMMEGRQTLWLKEKTVSSIEQKRKNQRRGEPRPNGMAHSEQHPMVKGLNLGRCCNKKRPSL